MIKPAGYEIPGYKIEREIGRGGMATVYVALQESLHRKVALKIMNPVLSTDEGFKQRFMNEGYIVSQLSHSHIVSVFDIGSQENYYYLSMDYLPGGSLHDRIRQGLPLERSLSIAKTLGRALGYAHQRGFIHRDIKPPNVLFREDGSPVLTDFGIAKAIGSSSQLTRAGFALGSVGYMSPEQSLGKPIDHRSDIYSFGVIVWEMLTGQTLYESSDAFSLALKHATAPIPQLPQELQQFQPLLERLLAKKPDDRFNSMEDFVSELENLRQQRAKHSDYTHVARAVTANHTVISPESAGDSDRTLVMPTPLPGSSAILPPTTATGSSPASPQPPPQQRSHKIIAIVSGFGLMLAAGAATLYLTPAMNPFRSDATSIQTAQSPVTVPSTPPTLTTTETVAPDEPATVASEDNTAERISRLLAQANVQWLSGQFTEPPGDNAFESYSRILELDPKNQEARDRLVEIGRRKLAMGYQERAQRLLDQGELDQSLKEIEQGLRLAPEHAGLLELRQLIKDRIAAANIDKLLTRAERQWQEGKYTEPPGDNAYASYQQVLSLEPDNSTARTGLINIGRLRLANRFEKTAEQLIAEGKLQGGLAEIEKGLRLMPEHEGLLALRRQVQARLNATGQ